MLQHQLHVPRIILHVFVAHYVVGPANAGLLPHAQLSGLVVHLVMQCAKLAREGVRGKLAVEEVELLQGIG